MGKIYETIDGRLREFIEAQPMFFVATAPAGPEGHINVSPKGGRGTFAVLDGNRFAYLDYLGSGVETLAHLRENGRIVVMVCAFEGSPRIVRLHGKGRAVLKDEPEFAELSAHFKPRLGARSVIVVDVTRIADSCGYGVPEMRLVGERTRLTYGLAAREEQGTLASYQADKNRRSLDGLPGLDVDLDRNRT